MCLHVLSEQVRILCVTQRFGEFPFFLRVFNYHMKLWQWMNEATCVRPSIKYYQSMFLIFTKHLDGVFLPTPTSLDHFTLWVCCFGDCWSTQLLYHQGLCTCYSLLDHSALSTPFSSQLLVIPAWRHSRIFTVLSYYTISML